jgi:hypothetical protein
MIRRFFTLLSAVLGPSRRRPRKVPRGMRCVIILSLIGCAIGCTHAEHVARVSVAGRSVDFRGAESVGRVRMLVPGEDDFSMRQYRALWDRGPDLGEQLVVLSARGSGLFGEEYQLRVFDRRGRMLREGIVTTWRGQFPYCLVEVNTSCKVLPDDYKDRWILAVGFVDPKKPFDPSGTIDLRGADAPEDAVARVDVEPVVWGEDYFGKKFTHGVGMLLHCPEIRWRPAERALSSHIYRSVGTREDDNR